MYLLQGFRLHSVISVSGPRSTQLSPPYWGGGLVQDLIRVFEPFPQVVLQSDHLVHSV